MERTAELPQGTVAAVLTHDGKQIGGVFGRPREFKTGSLGYNFSGRLVIDGKPFQFSGNAVMVGSRAE